jgi:hypothetical protein
METKQYDYMMIHTYLFGGQIDALGGCCEPANTFDEYLLDDVFQDQVEFEISCENIIRLQSVSFTYYGQDYDQDDLSSAFTEHARELYAEYQNLVEARKNEVA